MVLKPIQHNRVYLEAMTQIRAAIASGEYQRGEKLPSEQELTRIFQISRASLREALSGLIALGLVQARRGEGYYVVSTNSFAALELMLDHEGNPLEILEARKMIEPEIARLAARRREKNDLQAFKRVIDHARKIRSNSSTQVEAFILADNELHRQFAQATHNEILLSIEERLLGFMEQRGWSELKKRVDRHPDLVEKYWSEHELIWKAIKNGRPEKAYRYMRDHLEGIHQDVLQHVKDEGG